jgi:hypothetical protein
MAGKPLAEPRAERTIPLPFEGNIWLVVRFPVWIVAGVCEAVTSRAPLGYEDGSGFHYGAVEA